MVKPKQINMKQIVTPVVTLCLIMGTTLSSISQTNKTKTMETVAKKSSKEVVQGFFTAFGNGNFDGVVNAFHDSCTIIAVRDTQRNGNQIYGTYKGKEGVKTFLSNLGNTFETKSFSVDNIIEENNVSFANGKFTHIVKSTGKSFSSDWALMCVIKDDKILEYRFFEDSEKFSASNR